jgi:hypothetical protein
MLKNDDNDSLNELRTKLQERVIKGIKTDGAWVDATNRDASAKRDLLREIDNLVNKALVDYEELRVAHIPKPKPKKRRQPRLEKLKINKGK